MANLVYLDKIRSFTEGSDTTCNFATCPTEYYTLSDIVMVIDQAVGAWILVSTVLATTDEKNANPPGMAPFFIGLSATAVGIVFGGNAGGAINPARDFGPRIWASFFNPKAFTGTEGQNNYYFFWIPIVGPLIGG